MKKQARSHNSTLRPGEPLKRKKGLKRPDREPGEIRSVDPPSARPRKPRRKPISQASPAQRAKVREIGRCQFCGRPGHDYLRIDPAHVIARSQDGCDDPLCVIALCREPCHREYDEHRLDVLPLLTKEEQAHAVLHAGIESARRRTAPSQYERSEG